MTSAMHIFGHSRPVSGPQATQSLWWFFSLRVRNSVLRTVADSAKPIRDIAPEAPDALTSCQICATAAKPVKGLALRRATAYVRGQITNHEQPSGATR